MKDATRVTMHQKQETGMKSKYVEFVLMEATLTQVFKQVVPLVHQTWLL